MTICGCGRNLGFLTFLNIKRDMARILRSGIAEIMPHYKAPHWSHQESASRRMIGDVWHTAELEQMGYKGSANSGYFLECSTYA